MHNADEPLDRDLVNALDALDYPAARPVRPVSVDDIIARARARRSRTRWRLAAAAVVMLAASAAAALPGSPVRRWVVSMFRGDAGVDATPQSARQALPTVTTPAEMHGVVTFIGDSAEVVFSDWQDSGDVVIRFVAAAELRVRSATPPAAYQVRPSGIQVHNAQSTANFDVDVADAAANVRLVVNGRLVFERREGRVVLGPEARPDGAYVVSLRRPGQQ